MGRFTRIPADTFSQIQTGAGVVLYDFDPENPDKVTDADVICPTTGGITAVCEPSYSDYGEDVDNCPANLLELKHLDSWNCRMEFTSLGTSPKSIRLSLGAADVDSNNPTHIIPRRDLKTSDARSIWYAGDRMDGGMVAVCLKKALSTSGLSLKTTKSGKGQTSVTLTGHTTVATQNEVPMEFWSTGLESIVLNSEDGISTGHTKITVVGRELTKDFKYRYKVGDETESVMYMDDLSEWGTEAADAAALADIVATTGKILSLAEVDKNSKAVAFGYVVVKAKEGE